MTSVDVVIAEDDASMRALLALAVRRAGFDPIACATGTELLSTLEAARERGRPPAMIVSDNRMPGLTGLAVAGTIRSWGWCVPFVLVTAFPDDRLNAEAAELQVDEVLGKPVSMQAVTRAIERLIRTSWRTCPWCGDVVERGECDDCRPTGTWCADRDIGGSD